MESISFMLSRVRWTRILAVIAVLALIVLIILAIPKRYSTKGDVGVDVSADPSSIKIGERSKIEIEIKNLNSARAVEVYVEAKTYDNNFLFTHTDDKIASKRDILVGPKESRKLSFEVRPLSGALPGKYRIDVKAREKSYAEGAQDTVYIKITEN